MTSSVPLHVHLRLDQATARRLDALKRLYPSLRSRAARVEFALDRGLTVLDVPPGESNPDEGIRGQSSRVTCGQRGDSVDAGSSNAVDDGRK